MSRTKPTSNPDSIVKQVFDLRRSGATYGQISELMRIPYYMVAHYCQLRTAQAARCAG